MQGLSSGRSYYQGPRRESFARGRGYNREHQQSDSTFYPSRPRGGRGCFRKNYYKGQQGASQDPTNSARCPSSRPGTLSECAPRRVNTTNWRREWDNSPCVPLRVNGALHVNGATAEPRRPGKLGDASGDRCRERQEEKKRKTDPGTVPRRHEERRRNH
ncbi:hypothetical protein NDU88_011456 [Pleurodeles waltl]|uniref:Uncharacterized protein n=1 Tax=Pleurodeles waltl TaxID=8319 RepID=A0AAV7S3T4_PLEWA|nr:hypothetical protein NDU88_011456 [Pleurodeles waltl]